MSVTLNVSALKTRESTSDPWQGTVVKSDAILDAGTITYDGTETYTAGTVGEELNSQRNTLSGLGSKVAVTSTSHTIKTGSYYSKIGSLVVGILTFTATSASNDTVYTNVPAPPLILPVLFRNSQDGSIGYFTASYDNNTLKLVTYGHTGSIAATNDIVVTFAYITNN